MPTLDRRLLAWSDSDTEDDDRLLGTPTSPGLAVDGGGSYDRACATATSVDDVLVPAGADDEGRDGKSSSPAGTRKACAAAGLVAVGCLGAYLAWRYCGSAGKLSPASP